MIVGEDEETMVWNRLLRFFSVLPSLHNSVIRAAGLHPDQICRRLRLLPAFAGAKLIDPLAEPSADEPKAHLSDIHNDAQLDAVWHAVHYVNRLCEAGIPLRLGLPALGVVVPVHVKGVVVNPLAAQQCRLHKVQPLWPRIGPFICDAGAGTPINGDREDFLRIKLR